MLNKFFTSLTALMVSISCAYACWFTFPDAKDNPHFSSVNYSSYDHFVEKNGTVYFINGPLDSNNNVSNYYKVSLPITTWFKVSPRQTNVNGEDKVYYIRSAKLFYKIIPGNDDANILSARWRLAKEINMGNNPKWNLDFNYAVRLFGTGTITKEMIEKNGDTISKGDGIIMAWWFVDNSDAGGVMNADEIENGSTEPVFNVGLKAIGFDNTYGESGYNPAFVMRVIYNGKIVKTGR